MSTKEANSIELNSKMNNDEPNSELIVREPIENSPFTIIGIENQWFGSMGKYRITEPMDTKEEVKEEVSKITWDRIVQVILIVTAEPKIKEELELKEEKA